MIGVEERTDKFNKSDQYSTVCLFFKEIPMFNPIYDFSEYPTQLYWRSLYSMTSSSITPSNVPSTAIIALTPDNRIVLIRRRDTEFWSLPGGEILWGESIKKNVRRKLATQTGLELVKIKHTAGLNYTADNSQAHSFSVVVVADVRGEIEIQDFSNVEKASFFALNELAIAKLSHTAITSS